LVFPSVTTRRQPRRRNQDSAVIGLRLAEHRLALSGSGCPRRFKITTADTLE
jgi:hypothetical protein